ncbi:MAG: NUDIX hydrolase [Candidatus Omnitrophota bacterium]
MDKGTVVFKGRLIELSVAQHTFPNGYVCRMEIIRHPGAVLIVPFVGRDRIVLIRQFRPVIDSYIWELPAGTLNKGEEPARCARRELIEEIGYRAGRLKKLGYIYPAPGYTTEKIHIYEGRDLVKVERRPEDDEDITPEIFSADGVRKLARSGKIVDAKTLAALALAKVI